jgi:hypothetical protein
LSMDICAHASLDIPVLSAKPTSTNVLRILVAMVLPVLMH